MTTLLVVGARPQFVKAAPVLREIERRGLAAPHILHTGQHFDREMSQIFFDDLELPPPSVNLGIGSGTHGSMTGRMVMAIEEVLLQQRPTDVVVFGDTNSTLAASIAASKLPLRLLHVEAGLRSFNRAMPEEINRVVTDHLSHVLLAPSDTAVANLRAEGIEGDKVVQTGDVMYDSVLLFGRHVNEHGDVRRALGLSSGSYVLATVHRAENTDDRDRLEAIVGGLAGVATDVEVVLPLHPRTATAVRTAHIDGLESLRVIPPVGFLDMLDLERHARLVVTDSGGVQKEAFFHGRPCVTLRDETEWVELVEGGWNRLVPPASASGVEAGVRAALAAGPGDDMAPYGDGRAAARIVDALIR